MRSGPRGLGAEGMAPVPAPGQQAVPPLSGPPRPRPWNGYWRQKTSGSSNPSSTGPRQVASAGEPVGWGEGEQEGLRHSGNGTRPNARRFKALWHPTTKTTDRPPRVHSWATDRPGSNRSVLTSLGSSSQQRLHRDPKAVPWSPSGTTRLPISWTNSGHEGKNSSLSLGGLLSWGVPSHGDRPAQRSPVLGGASPAFPSPSWGL